MKYDINKLNSMNIDKLVSMYLHYDLNEGLHFRGSERSKSDKKKILKVLTGSRKFEDLISKLDEHELKELISIHPNKEYVLDSIIHAIESGSLNPKKYAAYDFQNSYEKPTNLSNDFYNTFNKKGRFEKIKEMISGKKKDLTPKVEQLKKLEEIQYNRKYATGKKYEKLEKQPLDLPVDNARVEVKDSEMTKIFDKYGKLGREKGKIGLGGSNERVEIENEIKENMKNKYIEYLGKDNEEFAELIVKSEFENYSGNLFFIPYGSGRFSSHGHNSFMLYKKNTIGVLGNKRSWSKNLLEVEKIDNFTINGNNYETVYVVKSEFPPTEHAIEGKWAPIYEYYKKNSNGEFIRIGFGKYNTEKNEMQTTITTDVSGNIDNVTRETYDFDNKYKEYDNFITVNTNEIKGESTKITRKNMDEMIVKKSIHDYLGSDKQIADLTQIKNFKIIEPDGPQSSDENNNQVKISTAYAISYLDNGKEVYKIVLIDEDGKCKDYPNISTSKNENLYFPTGVSVGGYDLKSSLDELKKRDAIQSFIDVNNNKYSIYKDETGILRVARLVERSSGNMKFAEELDTYSLLKGDIKKLKEEYEKNNSSSSLSMSASKVKDIKKQKEKLMALQEELQNTNSLSIVDEKQDGPKM